MVYYIIIHDAKDKRFQKHIITLCGDKFIYETNIQNINRNSELGWFMNVVMLLLSRNSYIS
jgi:hypothetical protein